MNIYCGHPYEELCKEFLLESNLYNIEKIGRWWYKDNEIDIVALNETSKEILLCECKWSNNVNALTIVSELEKKSAYVDWNLKDRKESYAVFAKSFSKKIESLNGKKVHCFDLHDIENIMKKR